MPRNSARAWSYATSPPFVIPTPGGKSADRALALASFARDEGAAAASTRAWRPSMGFMFIAAIAFAALASFLNTTYAFVDLRSATSAPVITLPALGILPSWSTGTERRRTDATAPNGANAARSFLVLMATGRFPTKTVRRSASSASSGPGVVTGSPFFFSSFAAFFLIFFFESLGDRRSSDSESEPSDSSESLEDDDEESSSSSVSEAAAASRFPFSRFRARPVVHHRRGSFVRLLDARALLRATCRGGLLVALLATLAVGAVGVAVGVVVRRGIAFGTAAA